MQSETGESSSSIYRRGDDDAWPAVLSALREGAVLRYHPKIQRCAVEGIDVRHRHHGRTISAARVRRLEREGVLVNSGVDLYRLATYAMPRRCRVCGCTDDQACPGGCYWVEADLCSACVVPADMSEMHS